MQISASILSIEKERATQKFYNLEVANIDMFHIDIMDGKFVQNNTCEIMKDYAITISHISQTPLDIHLMVNDVDEFIEEYIDMKPEYITFHYEADKGNILNYIKKLKANGIKIGISVKPNTNIEEIYPYLDKINLVLVMSVEPGYGGQVFIPSTIDKIKKLKEYINTNELEIDIEVDGGINNNNIK